MARQFTAASIALLALQGKLSLDDEVRKYIPELNPVTKELSSYAPHRRQEIGLAQAQNSVTGCIGDGRPC